MPATVRRFHRLSVFLLVLATACAGDAATSPAATSGDGAAPVLAAVGTRGFPHPPNGKALGQVARCTHRERRLGTGVIGERGGTVRIGDDYLVIPPGALDARVKIVGEVVAGEAAAIRLEPQGLRFRRPATLLLDARGCDIERSDMPALLYLDDSGSLLETIDARYDPESARLAAPIAHFSVYAVGV